MSKIGIKGFRLASSFCRVEENRHGGSAIYIKKGLNYRVRSDINKLGLEDHFECCSCEVTINSFNLVIVSLYRPPSGDIKDFFDKLKELICRSDKNNIMVAGDFNVDFLIKNKNSLRLMSVLNSFGLKHTIKEPTRITQTTQKCIDNILTNLREDLISVVLHYHISDHTAQKITFNVGKEVNTFIHQIYFSNDNKIKFKKLLSETYREKIYNLDHSFRK